MSGFTNVTASNLRDASGNPITNATATFTPNYSYRTGGTHGQVTLNPIQVPVNNGTLSVVLGDTSLSTPQNVSYKLVVKDNLTGDVLLAKGYEQIQPSGDSWSLDDYVIPVNGPLVLITAGPKGDKGDTGSNGVASAPQLYGTIGPVTAQLLQSVNLFNGTFAVGFVGQDGAVHHDYDPQYFYGAVFVGGLTSIVCDTTIGNVAGIYPQFFDLFGAHIGQAASADITAGQAITVPAGAWTMTFNCGSAQAQPSSYGAAAFSSGSQLPAVKPSRVLPNTAAVAKQISDATGSVALTSAMLAEQMSNATILAGGNLWDYTTAQIGIVKFDGSISTEYGNSYKWIRAYVGHLQGQQIVANIYLQAFGDGSKGWFKRADLSSLSVASNADIAPGSSFTVPTGACWFDVGVEANTLTSGIVLNAGNTVIPGIAHPSWTAVLAAADAVALQNRPFANQRALFIGDSITAGGQWPALFAAYHRLAGYDILGYPGHPTGDAFIEYAVNTFNNPTGPTIVQQLAAKLADKDIVLIKHGTNDHDTPIGAIGDPAYVPTPYNSGQASSTSFFGSVRYVRDTLLAAIALSGRSIRVIYCTPYHTTLTCDAYVMPDGTAKPASNTSLSQIVNAIKQTCSQDGIPVIDNAATCNINRYNWPNTLLLEADGVMRIHPTSLGYQYLGLNIARQAAQFAQA